MKKTSMELWVALNKEIVIKLTTEEATDRVKKENASLSAAGLWDIQRRARPRMRRSYF